MGGTPIGRRAIVRAAAAAGLVCTGEQADALAEYLALLRRWNRVFNLTGLDEPRALVERHLVESLSLAPRLLGPRIADVGSGAGLPGIPLAIAVPAHRFVLIESRAKRARFLRHAIGALQLSNARVEHGRAETMTGTAPFDTAVARAVAPPAALLGLLRPLTRPGSRVLLLTAERLAQAYEGLAEDFAVRGVEVPPAGAARSSTVVLERVV